MKKIYVLLFVLTVFLSSCSSGGGSGESGESVTILGYLPVTNLEDEDLRLFKVGKDNFGLPNNTVNAMAQNINDANTRIYIMAGSGNIDHTDQPYSQNYLIKDFTKGYQYKITKGKAEIINQGTAKVSCYTGANPVNPDAADPSKCEDMANPEVISDFLAKGIRENKTSKYVLFISTHGGGSFLGMGYTGYLNIDAEAFKKALELVRVKLGNPYFKFDTIILNSCLMGNADFMYVAKDYANYFIASESTQPVAAWDFAPYIQAIGAGQDSITAGKTLIDKFIGNVINLDVGSTISMVDLSKVEAVSTAFDNMTSALITNYDKGGESKVKTSNNVFLSAYNSLLYDIAQSDIHSFAERLGYNDAYYTDDYTANKQELQAAVEDAVIYSSSYGEYSESKGISFSVFVEAYAGVSGLPIANSGFAPKYFDFMTKISKELYDASLQIGNTTVTESYNNGIEYTVKTPVAITNATLDVGSIDTANHNNNRVGTLTNIIIPDPVYDAAQNQFIYTLNFGDPQTGTIFTLNNNPIRVKNISFFNKDRKVLYYKTTETQCVDIEGGVDICDIVFSYDTTTKEIKLNNLIIYKPSEDPTQRTPANVGFSFLQYLDRIKIEPLNDGSVQAKAANSEDTVPTYDIQLDKSQPYGGLNIQASTYSIDAGKTGKFRLAFNSVANIGNSNKLNTSTWKTLDEIKQPQP